VPASLFTEPAPVLSTIGGFLGGLNDPSSICLVNQFFDPFALLPAAAWTEIRGGIDNDRCWLRTMIEHGVSNMAT
jgi:hypothetical protein